MLPYWAIGNNELKELQDAPDEGTLMACPRCGAEHMVTYSGAKTIGTVQCGDGHSYIVVVSGKIVEKGKRIGSRGSIP